MWTTTSRSRGGRSDRSGHSRQSSKSEHCSPGPSPQNAKKPSRDRLERRRKQKRDSACRRRKHEKQSFEDMQTDYEELRHRNLKLKEHVAQLKTWRYCAEFYLDIHKQLTHLAPTPQPPPPQPPPPLPPPPPSLQPPPPQVQLPSSSSSSTSSSSSSLSSLSSSLVLSSQEAWIPESLITAEEDVTIADDGSELLEMLLNTDEILDGLKSPEPMDINLQGPMQEDAMAPETVTGSVSTASGKAQDDRLFSCIISVEDQPVASSSSSSSSPSSSSSCGTDKTAVVQHITSGGLLLDKLEGQPSMSTPDQQMAIKEATLIPEATTGSVTSVSGTAQTPGLFTLDRSLDEMTASSSFDVMGKMSSIHLPAPSTQPEGAKDTALQSLMAMYLHDSDEDPASPNMFADYSWLLEDVRQRAPIPEYTQGSADTPAEAAESPFWL